MTPPCLYVWQPGSHVSGPISLEDFRLAGNIDIPAHINPGCRMLIGCGLDGVGFAAVDVVLWLRGIVFFQFIQAAYKGIIHLWFEFDKHSRDGAAIAGNQHRKTAHIVQTAIGEQGRAHLRHGAAPQVCVWLPWQQCAIDKKRQQLRRRWGVGWIHLDLPVGIC